MVSNLSCMFCPPEGSVSVLVNRQAAMFSEPLTFNDRQAAMFSEPLTFNDSLANEPDEEPRYSHDCFSSRFFLNLLFYQFPLKSG